MCKIFAITDLSKVKIDTKLLAAIKKEVTKVDNHGFGYAVLGNDGSIGGERSVRVSGFKALGKGLDNLSRTEQLPIVRRTAERFGDLGMALNSPKSMIAHGRFSTNTVSLENTHPYYNGDMALIHNGVVQDASGEVTQSLVTDNDTEILLRYWEIDGVQAIEENVTGYYAMATLTTDGELHVVRDSRAPLHLAWVRSINSFMIATQPEIIKGVCAAMKWKFEPIEAMNDDCHAIFSGNDILAHRTIKPRVATYSSEFASKASSAFQTAKPPLTYRKWESNWQDEGEDVPAYREYQKEISALEADGEMGDVQELDFSPSARSHHR